MKIHLIKHLGRINNYYDNLDICFYDLVSNDKNEYFIQETYHHQLGESISYYPIDIEKYIPQETAEWALDYIKKHSKDKIVIDK